MKYIKCYNSFTFRYINRYSKQKNNSYPYKDRIIIVRKIIYIYMYK